MDQYGMYSDEELISRYRQGEKGVSDYLMDKYKGLVRQRARTMYLIGAEPDDLIQEGMIGLFKAIRDYQPGREAAFVTFARMCIERQIYNAVQNSNRKKNIPLNTYISLSREDAAPLAEHTCVQSPEAIVISRENARDMQEEIYGQLSRMERQVLTFFLEGEDYARIAERMGKTPKSIDNALQRIRRKIRDLTEKKAADGSV